MSNKLIIPGLDHSLYQEDGHFVWRQEPGHVTPKARSKKSAKRNKSKYWNSEESRRRQIPIRADLA
jgi:hypothetical protein